MMAVDKRGRKLPKGIQQRYDGYEARPMIDGKRYLIHGKTIAEVQKQVTELKYKLAHGLFIEKQKVLFDEWFNVWIREYKEGRVKIGTIAAYQKYYNGCIKQRLGDTYINDIRGEHIQRLYNNLLKEGYAVSSIKVISAVLNGCFIQALKNGLIERNPVEAATLPKKIGGKGMRKVLTKEQQELFMKYAEDSYLYNLFAVMLRTGMRSGEIRGLKYTDIDKKKKVIHVQRTLKYLEHRGFFEDTPKTNKSKRDIPLTKEILALLEAQYVFWRFDIIKLDRYLFCNEKGEPLSRERVQGEINRIIKRINEDGYDFERITPHVFRHTFATRAIEAGMNPQVLKTILGHSSLAMTMDLYSHVMEDVKSEEMEKISNAF